MHKSCVRRLLEVRYVFAMVKRSRTIASEFNFATAAPTLFANLRCVAGDHKKRSAGAAKSPDLTFFSAMVPANGARISA